MLKPLRLISEDPSVASGPKPLSNDSFPEPCKAVTILTTKESQLLLITCSKCPGRDLKLDLSDVKPETLLQTKPSYFFSLSFPICKMGRFWTSANDFWNPSLPCWLTSLRYYPSSWTKNQKHNNNNNKKQTTEKTVFLKKNVPIRLLLIQRSWLSCLFGSKIADRFRR